MPLFTNHVQYPDGITIEDTTPQLTYDCTRSQFAEDIYDVQFRVNGDVVYEQADGNPGDWDTGDGGSRSGSTIQYTLTAGEILNSGLHTFAVYHKLYYQPTWVEEVSVTFTVLGPPTKAENPTPANAAVEADFSSLVLGWDDGGGADDFDVYMGPSGSLVLVAENLVPTTLTVDISDVPLEQIIYWRVDAKNVLGTTTGDVWNFDARPAKVVNPGPADVASDIRLYPEYSWDASTVATSYHLYVGIGELMGAVAIDVPDITDLNYDSAVVDFQNGFVWGYNSVYHWRVDAVNDFGTTEGDEWTFNSIDYDPPLPTGVSLTDVVGEEGEPTGTPTGENNMITVKRLVAAANNTIFFEDE